MSSHRNHSNKHALPDDPVYIEFPHSDGNSNTWPKNTTEEIDDEGCVNYMRPVDLDESICIKWRVGVGDAISMQLKYPTGNHVLRDFPSGYRMFDHNKGKAGSPRHDVYLFGPGCRFRSVPEFIPHAIWLMGDLSEQCNCKYCSKKPQREITSSMGNILRLSPSPSRLLPRTRADKPVVKSRLAERLKDSNKFYASVQRSSALPQISPHIQTDSIMLVERNNDLRAAVRTPLAECLPRYFREGELVWCAIEPIVGPQDEAIDFWPAIIDEVSLRNQREGLPHGSIPESIHQHTGYTVKFLAISRTYYFPDTMVIPYQSYICPNGILQQMVQRPVGDWEDLNAEALSKFDPCPPQPAITPTFFDTLTPFALALQIASKLCEFWCLTDEWDAKLTLPPLPRPVPPLSSLQSAIEFAGSNNAANRAPGPRVLTQTRFQGLWWGGERIWAGDLVRLKVPRSCLAPAGAQNIFAPSGPGEKNKIEINNTGGDPADFGATSRGVFLKIDSISLVDGTTGRRECRVLGMLYELAEVDWVDPNLPRFGLSENRSISAVKPPTPASAEGYPLPVAPTGYKYRAILAPGYEAVMSLSVISGRYYPCLLKHPKIKPLVAQVDIMDHDSILEVGHLWSLEGLFGGYKNSVNPRVYKATREKMMSDATKTAKGELEEHIRVRLAETDSGMEIDSL
ncbi:hypothetical protein GGX14DRAFT_648908 [Mycena pura]|uniref:Cryptic loci regulator 2 N-terminal domain-containing protein n=1 Tax=Mycena pura TaxID=153505 RepID=A0AAD6YMW0_9AGAR|nr:hypothetical protein GGX14DRAFT_648908 [Mycena pura]